MAQDPENPEAEAVVAAVQAKEDDVEEINAFAAKRLRLLPLVSFLPFVFVSFQARSRFTFVFFISASSPYRSCRYHLCFTLAWHLVSVFFFFCAVCSYVNLFYGCRSPVCRICPVESV